MSSNQVNPERQAAFRQVRRALLAGACVFAMGLALDYPVGRLTAWTSQYGVSRSIMARYGAEMDAYLPSRVSGAALRFWAGKALTHLRNMNGGAPPFMGWVLVLSVLAGAYPLRRLGHMDCRFDFTLHGRARRMPQAEAAHRQLFAPTGLILGQAWGRWIRNWEPLTAILLAPPGSGKSVQIKTNLLADWPDAHIDQPTLIRAAALLALWGAGAAGAWTLHAPLAALIFGACAARAGMSAVAALSVPVDPPRPSMIIHDIKGEMVRD